MSFAQEVKDFLAGYQVTSEMSNKRAQREQDKAYNDAMLELKKGDQAIDRETLELRKKAAAARSALGGGRGGSGAVKPSESRAQTRFEWEKEDREAKRRAEEAGVAAEEAISGMDTSGFDLEAIPGYEEEQEFAYGGMVRRAYAEGGTVLPDDPEEDPDLPNLEPMRPRPRPAAPEAAIPTEAPAAPVAPAAQAPAPEKPAPSPKATKIVVEAAQEAGKAVMDSFEREVKTPTAAVGDGSNKSGMDFVKGSGGMTPEEITQMEKGVDPNGELPPYLTTAATMSSAYKFFMQKDPPEPEKALKAAQGYLLGVKGLTQTLGSLAVDAIKQGDAESACRLFNDACNRFPSGHEIIVTPDPKYGLTYVVKNEGGIIEEGKMDPNQFIQASSEVANGKAFTQQMIQFVSANQKTGGNFSKALADVEEAAGRLAGITEARTNAGEDTPEYEQLVAAEKEARAALTAAEGSARDLASMRTPKKGRTPATEASVNSSILTARKAGLDMAVPYEMPESDAPADDRNVWERNAPTFLGGREAPGTAAPAAIPTEAPAPAPAQVQAPAPAQAPVTPPGNTPKLKPVPPDALAAAKAAIAKGADRAAVIKRLTDNGYSADGL